MKKLITLFLCLSVFFATGVCTAVSADNSIPVRVGVYENRPKIFVDEKGQASGFWPDILRYIASEEGWNIEYVKGSWNECLEKLGKNEIDIMPDVAYSEERGRIYDFSEEMVYVSWSTVYAKEGSGIQSIIDLEGKTVAVLKGSINVEGPEGIKTLAKDFNINCGFVEVDSYTGVFELVGNKEADAGVVSKDFGNQNDANYNVVRTPIIFQPSQLYFAFPKGSSFSSYLIERIDSRVSQMKQDGNSIYYKSLESWFGIKPVEKPVIPDWLKWLLIGLAGLAVLLAAIPVIIKYQVNKKITALTKEITESHKKYLELVENLNSGVAVYEAVNGGDDFVIVDFNRAGERIEKISRDKVISKRVLEVFPGVKEFGLLEVFQRVWRTGVPEHSPVVFYKDNRISGWRENYVYKLPDGKIVAQYDDVTQLKQAEDALKESEEKFSKAFNAAPNLMTITSEEGRIIEINEAYCKLLGYEREEFVGHTMAEYGIIDPERRRRTVQRVKAEGIVENLLVDMRTKSGKIRSVILSMRPISLSGKEYQLSVATDITERKRAEEDLRESERRFHGTLDNMLEGCQIIGFDWRYLYINDAGAKHGRRSKEELIGHTMMEMYPGIENSEMFTQLRRCMQKRVVHHMENEFVYPDGTTSWFELGIEPVPEGVFILSLDITERKQAAEALRESEEKFSKAFSSAGNAICITDLSNSKFVEVNESYCRFTGYTREEAIGHTSAELKLWVHEEELKRFMSTLSEEGQFFNQEFHSRHKSGEIRIGLGAAEIVSIGGKSHRIVVITDITDRKKAEDALQRSEENFRHSIYDSPLGICIINTDVNIIYANQAMLTIYGYDSLEELNATPAEKRYTPESFAMHQELDEKIKRGEDFPSNFETSIVRKDGQIRHLNVWLKKVIWDSRKQYQVFYQDITERKEAEEALKESEENFHHSIDESPLGICIVRADAKIIYTNRAMLTLYGYDSLEELEATPLKKRFTPESYTALQARIEKTQRGEYVPSSIEINIVRRDGQIRYLNMWRKEVLWDGKTQYQVIYQDMTERKEAEETLKESEEFNSTLLNNTPNAIFVTYPDGTIRYVNPAFEKLTGFSLSEIIGSKTPYPWWPDNMKQEIEAGLKRTVQEEISLGNQLTKQMTFQKKNGELFIVELNAAVINKEGKRQYIMVVWKDITQRMKAEESLKTSEENFRHSLDDSPLGIRIVDNTGETLYINRELVNIYGYRDTKEFNSVSIEKHFTPESYKYHLLLRKKMERGEPTPEKIETSFVRKDGEIRYLEVMRKDVLWNSKTRHMLLYEDITERKQAETKLRSAEQNFRNSLDDSPMGTIIVTKTGEFLYANKAILDIYGYSSIDELRNIPVNERLTPESYKEYLERLEKRERGELVPAIYESGIVRKTGEVRYVAIWRKEVEWNGETQYQVIHQDITERKRTEAKLKTTEQNFRNSMDSSPLGIRIVTGEGDLLYANKAMLEIYGYDSIDELRNTPSKEHYTPESYYEHRERVKKRQSGVPVPDSYEIDIIRKTGEIRHLAVYRKELVWNGETQYQVIYQDITQNKQAEELFKTLALNSPVGVYIVQDKKFVYTNPQFQKITGFKERELLKMNSMEMVAKEDRDKVKENAIKKLKGKLTSPYEFRIVGKNGEIRWASESVAPIQYRGKSAVIGSFQDITGAKRAEEQLIVTDRLSSIGELASGIAHELNNPLTGVIGLSDLLLTRKGLPADMKDDLQMINNEAHRTANVVRNLLTFARKHPQEKKPIDIEGVIKMVLELRAYEQKVQNLQIVTQFTPGLPQVNANAFQIMQVFVNIIINAEFFMIEAHHKGTLIIKTEQVGKAIRTTLADDGPGISRETMGKLFNPFFTTKEVGKGTGLGLSICHGIVTEHGGRIWAESKPGEGATFFIDLPVLQKSRRK